MARAGTWSWPYATRAAASRPPNSTASSAGSAAPSRPATARRAGSGSACPSCRPSPKPTRARSGCTAPATKDPRSRWSSPPSPTPWPADRPGISRVSACLGRVGGHQRGEGHDVGAVVVALLIEAAPAGDQPEGGVIGVAVDGAGGELVLGVKTAPGDLEYGHLPVGQGDVDQVPRLQGTEAEEHRRTSAQRVHVALDDGRPQLARGR